MLNYVLACCVVSERSSEGLGLFRKGYKTIAKTANLAFTNVGRSSNNYTTVVRFVRSSLVNRRSIVNQLNCEHCEARLEDFIVNRSSYRSSPSVRAKFLSSN